jgi:hypothetical protein
MALYAHSLGLGACLMDSVRIALLQSRRLRRRIGMPRGHKALGALVLGYPEEKALNLIEGLGLGIGWNGAPGQAAQGMA